MVSAQQQKIERLNEVVCDWNGRILPSIISTVERANRILGENGPRLSASQVVMHRRAPGSELPDTPLLPRMAIVVDQTAQLGLPEDNISRRISTQLQVGVNDDGRIEMLPSSELGIHVSVFDAHEVSEDKIKIMVADIVDAVTQRD